MSSIPGSPRIVKEKSTSAGFTNLFSLVKRPMCHGTTERKLKTKVLVFQDGPFLWYSSRSEKEILTTLRIEEGRYTGVNLK